MMTRELIAYIKAQLAAGTSKEEIIRILLAQTWTQQDIDSAFEFVSKPAAPPTPVSAPAPASSVAQAPVVRPVAQSPAAPPLTYASPGTVKVMPHKSHAGTIIAVVILLVLIGGAAAVYALPNVRSIVLSAIPLDLFGPKLEQQIIAVPPPRAEERPSAASSTPGTAAPVATSTNASAQAQFSVRKVPSDLILNMGQTERTLELSVTTRPMPADPTTLSLCATLTDANDVAVSETDCWPLEKYGMWSYMSGGDLNLAPLNARASFWAKGSHLARIRFELIEGLVTDYTDKRARDKYQLLARDDTGTFKFVIE